LWISLAISLNVETHACERLRRIQDVTSEELSMNPSDIPADARPLIAEQPRAQAMPGAGLSSVMWPDYLAGQPDKPVRVLLVDDDAHIRMVIAQEVMNDPRTLVVAQAGSVREGRKAIRQHEFAFERKVQHKNWRRTVIIQ
jgi:hypothetical protein